MRIDRALLVGALVLCGATAGCKRPTTLTCGPRDGSTVACVDGAPLSAKIVEQFIEEPWWVPGVAALPDARKAALDRAVRTHLFAAEARRRGLKLADGRPDVQATWAQALLADELAKRGISRDAISDEQAKQHYEDNKEMFNQVDRVDAQVIALRDGRTAEAVYAEAARADEAAFKALVARHSIDEKSRAAGGDRVIIAAQDEDRAMLKMALSLRKKGALGGPFETSDGRWWLMRVKESPIEHPKPLDAVLMLTVKNAMVDARRRQIAGELEQEMRPKARVEVDPEALGKLKLPAVK